MARKRPARASRVDVAHVYPMSHTPFDTLTFSSSDIQGIHFPHGNLLVVALIIANYRVKRVLVDTESSFDIIFTVVFD